MRCRLPALLLLLLLGACQPQALFVVLPNADGRPGSGAISVNDGKTTTNLNQAYAAADMHSGTAEATKVEPDDILSLFKAAFAARPPLPHKYALYFDVDTTELTPESLKAYRAASEDIHKRPVYEVEIIGYADTLARDFYNNKLSYFRGKKIHDWLVAEGVNPNAITVGWRGKHELADPTPDQVADALNRRVIVTVR